MEQGLGDAGAETYGHGEDTRASCGPGEHPGRQACLLHLKELPLRGGHGTVTGSARPLQVQAVGGRGGDEGEKGRG